MAETETRARWRERVRSWRASGKTAEEFSAGHGFPASTLRWWSSRLGREAVPPAPMVRLARLVRPPAAEGPPPCGAILIELRDIAARITVELGSDRATLAMVMDVLGVRGAR
jgi:hypothetical protein